MARKKPEYKIDEIHLKSIETSLLECLNAVNVQLARRDVPPSQMEWHSLTALATQLRQATAEADRLATLRYVTESNKIEPV